MDAQKCVEQLLKATEETFSVNVFYQRDDTRTDGNYVRFHGSGWMGEEEALMWLTGYVHGFTAAAKRDRK